MSQTFPKTDELTVFRPTDKDVCKIAETIFANSPNSFDDVADCELCLRYCSIACFPKYCTDSVGYSGPLYIVVWGASEDCITVLRPNIDNKDELVIVHEHV